MTEITEPNDIMFGLENHTGYRCPVCKRATMLPKPDTRPYTMFLWSTDNEGKKIIDINGTLYSNARAIQLRDELNRLLS